MSLKDKIALLPTEPGCYLMRNESDEIIYVGKAKNLKNRVKSYFTGAHNEKTTRLVSEIRDFNYVLTNSERESLILENNLIKQYLPKYNIRLVDDKTYPYIELTEEEHPKLQVVRQKEIKGRVFGPYPNVYAARETVRLLNRLYPFRKCDILPKKACLYYHIGQCLAPCIHPEVDYQNTIKDLTKFLKGDTKDVLQRLNEEMNMASDLMQFEKAIELRDMIQHIEATTEKQIINLNDFKDRDAISYAYSKDDISLAILVMRQGKIIDHHQVVFAYAGEVIDNVLSYLQQFYENQLPDELLFSERFNPDDVEPFFGKKAIIPKIGDKKKVVDLASKNADYDLEHHFMLYRHRDEKRQKALDDLSELIKKEVKWIDIFDNAQLFGTAPISACVVFKDNAFDKKSYRKYHLQTTTNDDYQAMKEVTYRRYQKALLENLEFPDLILVDGGKGQLNAAQEILDSLGIKIAIAGLKKNSKHTLEALVYQGEVIPLLKQSELYKFLLKLSEEVHRFAITFHRETRKKKAKTSILDDIKGLGEKRKKLLLSHFNSIDAIKEASIEELKSLGIPENVCKTIKEELL
ncbi:MAG: excinuclease ABC subunit C [Tenericutes bacterium GWC2_34_14]|nr:MAG: excinuclease ABC subunit C [Tenericutes bacterium GWC2_34_14]OHE33848.1 MAG: excinuclease ABC subunit C [Tenericutes bacterium GWE2_34_108]OHE36583.1 MAG: excinuclease ABC subunit C [Tenericutes bacterium GWF1_35_14]OHE37841.1 MAG: excinuclease ABC subunit C [Tenericutes bacterium GWF2_35_184]OHE45296.1 MAG: excinuclease ABC subunit C [Tenericutes bacterium RIFOXYA2_FULL_36_32]OHE45932.1 MAG: excinuclease ABC subunit C [Tenericutes bacterium RIFOXYA12_FULL_35_10]OHE50134.1 MAG: excinu